ncbi:unnamed protein product [Cuscuta campestris]|uniref:Uncharacterized protein n=1 Tax=Cuscuta campestris TaxID=132261 RepID=A0A484LQ09_9ASTE|nr:unnamed protein product [Cuscuta campestris]
MRTISGGVLSMAPVSLSDAAAIIADFAASDTGASDAVSVYISRAADAFNHLVQFHNRCSQGHVLQLKSLRNADIVKKEEGDEEEPQKIPEGNHKNGKHKKKRDSDSRNRNLIKTEMNSVKVEQRGEEMKNHSAEKVKIKEVSCAGKYHENNTEKKVKPERSPANSVKKENKQKSFSEALVAETKKNHKKSGEGNGGSEGDTFSVETKKRKGEEVEGDLHSSKRRKSKKG